MLALHGCTVFFQVHAAIRKTWQRHKARSMSRRQRGRRHSSRATSSLFLSATDIVVIDNYRYKRRVCMQFFFSPSPSPPFAAGFPCIILSLKTKEHSSS